MKRVIATTIFCSFALGVALATTARPALAAIVFAEDFSDNSPGPNMALGTGFGSPTTDFTGDFTVTSGDNSRIHLGTSDTDYALYDFRFEATAIVPSGSSPWSSPFFGMGSRDASGAFFGEPPSPGVYVLLRPDNSTFHDRDLGTAGTTTNTVPIPSPSSLAHRLRLTWNSTTQQALFELDHNYLGGPFTADFSFTTDGSDNGFNGTNSRLFVGGGTGITFDDIVVTMPVPEPSTLGLLGIGGTLVWLKRRGAQLVLRGKSAA